MSDRSHPHTMQNVGQTKQICTSMMQLNVYNLNMFLLWEGPIFCSGVQQIPRKNGIYSIMKCPHLTELERGSNRLKKKNPIRDLKPIRTTRRVSEIINKCKKKWCICLTFWLSLVGQPTAISKSSAWQHPNHFQGCGVIAIQYHVQNQKS